LALLWLEIFIPYFTDTKTFTILEIAMPCPILLVIHLFFRVGISFVSFLLSFPRVFVPTSVFMNQTYFIPLNFLTLGVGKMDEVNCVIK
jgi:hypothetical protein